MNLKLWSFHIRDLGVDGLKELSYSATQYPEILKKLLKELNAQEGFYLATCNRVEFLIASSEKLSQPIFTKFKPKTFSNKKDIFTHLLKVACSMDSMVFGENQILGQIKNAFTEQQKLKLVGPELSKILNLVLREAKAIRTQTQLTRLQTSVSSVAAKILNSKVNKKAKILLVGYGETHKLMHKSLEKKNFKNISITNRSALKIPGEISWTDFNNAELSHYDVISFATSSEKYLLTPEILENTKAHLIIDLCIPPNADSKMAQIHSAEYVGLDEIQKILNHDKKEALALKKQLKFIIEDSVHKMMGDISAQSINILIANNIQKSFEIHKTALSEDLGKLLSNLTHEQRKDLEAWSQKLIKKINHIHLKTYKEVVDVVQNQNRHAQK
jgi:glutamyl-tRNA reductase